MTTLDRIEKKTEANCGDITSLKVDMAKIAARVGSVFGIVGAVAIEGIRLLVDHLK